MAEKLSNQMKELSLQSDIIGESHEAELNFTSTLNEDFYSQRLNSLFAYDSLTLITLFFLPEKRLSAPDAGMACTIAEECFNQEMHRLVWCANNKIDIERAAVGGFNYRLTFSYINNAKARWGACCEEERLCNRIMCEC